MVRAALVVLLFLIAPAAAWAGDEVWSQDVPLRGEGTRLLQGAPARTFDLAGIHWQGRGSVLFRTRSTAGRWSGWRVAAPEAEDLPDAPERRPSRWRLGNPYWVGSSNGIEYRIRGDVRALRAWFVKTGGSSAPLRRVALAGSPSIVPRAAWQADEKIVRARPRYAPALRVAIVHHTAGTTKYSAAASASIVRGIELYHVRSNGWNDIGYNFLVDQYGQVFEGRGGGMTRNVVAAHAGGFNYGSVGVAVIGNYSSKSISPAARGALVRLLAWRLDVAHVDPLGTLTMRSGGNSKFRAGTPVTLRAVSAHRDVGLTSCPGTMLYHQVPALTAAASAAGLPKLYEPAVRGRLGGPIRFTARLSGPAAWRVSVIDAGGVVVATATGQGTAVDWTWDATLVPRAAYSWTIEVGAATRPAGGHIGATPAPPPPQPVLADLAVEPAVVSPNGDGFADTLTIAYTLRSKLPVTATIRNAEALVVAPLFTDQVQAARRQSFPWDVASLPDGLYVLSVSARTPDGRAELLERDFVIDRTLAAVTAVPAVVSPNGDGRDDAGAVSFTLAAPAEVTVQIEQAGAVVTVLHAGPLPAGPQQLAWDGSTPTGPAPDGAYEVVVLARTPLTTIRQTAPLTLNRSA